MVEYLPDQANLKDLGSHQPKDVPNHFVLLAAVTTADQLWTSIAELPDVPPGRRTSPGFVDHVAKPDRVLRPR